MRRTYITLIVTVIAILGQASYWCYDATKETTRVTDEFSEAVRRVVSDSISLEIEEAYSGKRLVIDRSDPELAEILQYLNAASTVRIIPKTTVVGNQTVRVTIPYTYGIFLTFKLEDGSEVWFNLSKRDLWFESDEAIYEVSVDLSLNDVLNQLLSRVVVTSSTMPDTTLSEFTVPGSTSIMVLAALAALSMRRKRQ